MSQRVTRVGEFCSHSTTEREVRASDCELVHITALNRDDRDSQVEQAVVQLQMENVEHEDRLAVLEAEGISNELNSEIEDLSSRLTIVQSENASLNDRIERLEKLIDAMKKTS